MSRIDMDILQSLHKYKFLRGSFKRRVEEMIAQDTAYSYDYARDVLKAPFPLGEEAIASSSLAFQYAKYVLKAPFPLGERTIARYADLSYLYANDILKDRFIMGEKVIADSDFASSYAHSVLHIVTRTALKEWREQALNSEEGGMSWEE